MTRRSGVEPRSSGVHVNAGLQAELAPAVSIANIVQEVKTGTDTVTQDLNLRSDSPSAQDAALTPQSAAGTGTSSPAASSRLRRGC